LFQRETCVPSISIDDMKSVASSRNVPVGVVLAKDRTFITASGIDTQSAAYPGSAFAG
jgi:hypothetical protein